MRLSETITIYLAAGAPFAVSYFLHARRDRGRAHLMLKAIAAGLLWPLAALRLVLARQPQPSPEEVGAQLHETKLDETKRSLLAALREVSQLSSEAFGAACEKLERAACVLRDSVEKYIGLAQAAAEASEDAPPDEREMELCRVAGRRGDDLLMAGRCVHRRNVARLKEHHARARTQLLHALAEIGEAVEIELQPMAANAAAAHRLSLAILRLYGQAIDLLSLSDDASAAMRAAQLLNQECARLRRLQAAEHEKGEESCTTHTARPSLASLSNRTPLAQG
jgi:hypothetical protein